MQANEASVTIQEQEEESPQQMYFGNSNETQEQFEAAECGLRPIDSCHNCSGCSSFTLE